MYMTVCVHLCSSMFMCPQISRQNTFVNFTSLMKLSLRNIQYLVWCVLGVLMRTKVFKSSPSLPSLPPSLTLLPPSLTLLPPLSLSSLPPSLLPHSLSSLPPSLPPSSLPRGHFYQFGEINSIHIAPAQKCAFVNFMSRQSAEQAASGSFNKLVLKGG